MNQIGMSIQGKLRAVGNFGKSFLKKPDAVIVEPEDLLVKSGKNEKEWTVLVYAEGRNHLAYSTNTAINKMEKAGSDENINVVVQSTIEPAWNERFAPDMENTNTRRYYITQDSDEGKINSPVTGDLGEKVPLNPETLADFLSWGIEKFPAKHYMVVIKKHGLGFAKTDRQVPLSARELDEALEKSEAKTGKSVDVLSFDSCSMEQLEVGYEIKEHVKVMAGSQEDIYAVDYPYDTFLSGMKEKAGKMSPKEVGELIVKTHETDVPRGIQTAIDLEKLKEVGKATKELVDSLIKENIPRDVLYTDMIRSASMEPQESRRFAFNFRDERGFLKNLMEDKNITSQEIKEKAKILDSMLSDSIIAHYIGDSKKKIKDGRGFNIYIPWKNPSKDLKENYGKLKFEKDTMWMKLIDYVFEDKDMAEDFGNTIKSSGKIEPEKLSLSQKFGKTVIHNYKKYVSPYLMITCKHSPSCSQYGREAIEKHGLIDGGKMAFMRILGCNPEATAKYDPVPDLSEHGEEVKCNIDHGEVPPDLQDNNLPEILISPPKTVEKSALRKSVENSIISAAKLTGKIIGGIAGALVALPIGTAMGAVIGTKAGTDKLNDLNKDLLSKYQKDSVKQFAKIEKAMAMPGEKVHNTIKKLTGGVAINEDTLNKLKDMIPLEITGSSIEFLKKTITDEKKLSILKSIINRKLPETGLVEGLKKADFSEKEIEIIVDSARNSQGMEKVDTMKPLIEKKFSEGKLREKLSALNFNEKEINIIAGNAGYTYNKVLAKVLGGAVGAVTGTVLGTAGASVIGYQWGSKFAGLFGQNYAKEKFGEFAKHVETEKILQYYYEK
jgi:putative membrane protein insertion efficiency factor